MVKDPQRLPALPASADARALRVEPAGITPVPLSPEEQALLVQRREREELAAAYDLACRRQQRHRFLSLAVPLAAYAWWSADWPCVALGQTPVRGAAAAPWWLEPAWTLLVVLYAWSILKQQWSIPLALVLGGAGYLAFYVGLSSAGLLPLNAVMGVLTGLVTVPVCSAVALWALSLE